MFHLRVLSAGRRARTAAEIVAGGEARQAREQSIPSASTSSSWSNQSPRVEECKAVARLFRSIASSSPDQLHLPPLPGWRRTLLFALAIPSRFTPEDFLHFCCWPYSERLQELRVIRIRYDPSTD
ncbi:uncharacterized protein LOC144712941 [Wolffia australiana]